jgi:hypothetical protein
MRRIFFSSHALASRCRVPLSPRASHSAHAVAQAPSTPPTRRAAQFNMRANTPSLNTGFMRDIQPRFGAAQGSNTTPVNNGTSVGTKERPASPILGHDENAKGSLEQAKYQAKRLLDEKEAKRTEKKRCCMRTHARVCVLSVNSQTKARNA